MLERIAARLPNTVNTARRISTGDIVEKACSMEARVEGAIVIVEPAKGTSRAAQVPPAFVVLRSIANARDQLLQLAPMDAGVRSGPGHVAFGAGEEPVDELPLDRAEHV